MRRSSKKRMVITGATGLLGRNLMFEILKRHIKNPESVEIIVLGRGRDNLDIQQRIEKILEVDGSRYLGLSPRAIASDKNFFRDSISCIHLDLDRDGLNLDTEDLYYLKERPVDLFFHVAALTDFRNDAVTINALRKTNVEGTKRILQLVSALNVGSFSYVGSAYSCGAASGTIRPDFINLKQQFRNPYEATKLEAEMLVRFFCEEKGLPCKFFRSSTICGRLMEPVMGAINKFDVFYAWAAFFLRAKYRHFGTFEGIYDTPYDMDVRIKYNPDAGLNIVPADYAAKALYETAAFQGGSGSYHLVNDNETPHSVYIPVMLKALNIRGVRHARELEGAGGKVETLYYRTVGRIYTPYIMSEPMLFDVSNLSEVLELSGLRCPEVDGASFKVLMDYAKRENFGMGSKLQEVEK